MYQIPKVKSREEPSWAAQTWPSHSPPLTPGCPPSLLPHLFAPAALESGQGLAGRETCTILQFLLLLFPYPSFLLSAIWGQVAQVSLTGTYRGPDGPALEYPAGSFL